jgi:hypothetical protein
LRSWISPLEILKNNSKRNIPDSYGVPTGPAIAILKYLILSAYGVAQIPSTGSADNLSVSFFNLYIIFTDLISYFYS